MDEQAVQQIAQQIGPQVINEAVRRALSGIDPNEVSAEDLMPLISALEQALVDPGSYPAAVQALIDSGVVEPGVMPEEFDATFVVLMLIVLTKVADALRGDAEPQNFKHGGLAAAGRALQAKGRNGDTMLAHINPAEAAMLKRAGGSGTINPETGLPEFFVKQIGKAFSGAVKSVTGAVKDVVKALGPVAPIVAAVVAPYAIPALAGSLGVSSLAAGALYGAGTSALTGGNVLQGALMGGLGGGLGEMVGGAANQYLGTNLGAAGQALLGNTLVGGLAGAATGRGFGSGAINALTGTMLGNTIGNLAGAGSGTPMGAGLQQAGRTIGQMSTVGMPLKQAVLGGALSGLTAGVMASRQTPTSVAKDVTADINSQLERVNSLLQDPSVPETAKEAYRNYAQQLQAGRSTLAGYAHTMNQPYEIAPNQAEFKRVEGLLTSPGTTPAYADTRGIYQDLGIAPTAPVANIGKTNFGFNVPTGIAAAAALAPLAMEGIASAQTPQQIQQAVKSSNPEYFNNLRLQSWDWDAIGKQAQAAGMPLGAYVATNWDDITRSTTYASPGGTTPNTQPVFMSKGGPLSKIAYLARGSGSGRADTIDARLSDGEYVIDAETVAMLGDGSTQAGAAKLDQMRAQLRKHKGRALAKGKFSPNAKSPLAYIKGAM